MDGPRITPGKTPVSFTGDAGEPETWNILLLCLTSVFSVTSYTQNSFAIQQPQ